MPLLFWMPLIIMSGLFGLALEPAKVARRSARRDHFDVDA